MRRIRQWVALAWFCLLGAVSAAGAQDLVPLPAPALVVDTAGVLDGAQRAALTDKLLAFERSHGSQIAVVIVPTTRPEDIASFGHRLGDAWKLGRPGVGDGVIVLVARQDKQLRIEVARALEGAIPDASAKRIIRELIGPAFSRGDYYGGIDAGVQALMLLIEQEQLPAVAATSSPLPHWGLMLAAALGAAVVLGGLLGRLSALPGGVLTYFAASQGLGWSTVFAVLAAVGVAIGLLVFARAPRRPAMAVSGRRHRQAATGSGGGGDWSFGAGGGDGGGSSSWSSGGGGDFSGGGASGSWD